MDKVQLEGERLVKLVEGVQMDASSIAKGLGVDLVAEFFDRKGVQNYMIEIGGEIRVKGKVINSARGISVDKPIDDATAANGSCSLCWLCGRGVMTSGNYRRFTWWMEKIFSHTINPRTGYPVQQDILGASVYAPTCMEADATRQRLWCWELKNLKK